VSLTEQYWEGWPTIVAPRPRSWVDPGTEPDPHFDRRWRVWVALSTIVGLVSVAAGDAASRHGWSYSSSSVLFWAGLLLIFVPTAVRILLPGTDQNERLTLVVALGIALYLVKVIASPDAFTFSDEYVHLRNTQDLLRTHHLFAFNPLLPTAAYYPGLAALTAGLVDLTGLSTFVSGLLIIGVARVLFSVCFFLIAKMVTRSDRAAAGASLVYAANPMFLFWSAAFSYENLALPLAAFVVWWLGRTRRGEGRITLIAAAIPVAAVVVTHHVVGFALAALLGAWWLAERLVLKTSGAPRRDVGLIALLTSAATLVWFFFVARPAASYLFSKNLFPAVRQTTSLILGHTAPRHLYSSGGYVSPAWETAAGFAAVILLLLALPWALYRAWPSRRRAPVVVAAIVAVSFPLSLIPRLSSAGVAISGRSSEYVFTGLACVLGLLALEATIRVAGKNGRRARHARMLRPYRTALTRHATEIAAVVLTIIFVGDITIGTAFYQRLPEATHPSGYPLSVQPDVVSASKWARAHLGINQRFGSDKLDSYALATYGEQFTLDENNVWPIFFTSATDAAFVRGIKTARVHYLFVDWSMTKGVPPTPGYYFSPDEPGAGQYRQVFPEAGLQKFSKSSCIQSVYNSGAIQIFDVSQIESGTCTPVPTTPNSSKGTPG
jgi:hypothetical protein